MQNVGFILDIIYEMKLDYGVPAVYFIFNKNEYDADTGQMTLMRTAYQMQSLIKLPQNVVRKVIQDIAYLAANKNFTYGGAYDEDSTIVIVDINDLPRGMVLNINNWFVIDEERYTVSKVEKIADCAYVIALHATLGALPYSVNIQRVQSYLGLQQAITSEYVGAVP